MQSNSANSRAEVANVTVVTDDRQIIVPHTITEVVEVNTPGPQGPVGPTGPQGPSVPFANIGNGVYATTSSLQVTGSFTVSGSSTFTNIGPAVFSGSTSLVGATTMSSALVSGNVQVLGTASINVLQISTTINSTGSNILGDASNDTQTLYGAVIIPTGSLVVTGSVRFRSQGSTSVNNALTVQNSSGTNLLQAREDGLVTLGASSWLGIGETSRYLYRALNATGIFTIANDSTVGSSIDMFGSSHATLPNLIRVTAPSSLQITGSLGISNTASFGGLSLHNQNRIDDVSMLNFDTTNNYYQVGKSGNDLLIRTAANNLLLFGGKDTTLQTGVIGGHFYFKGGNVNGFGQSNFSIADYNGSNTRFFVSGSGNVGIGTTTPGYNLDVASSTSVSQIGLTSAANSLGEINFINSGYSIPRWTMRATGAANGSSGNLVFQRLANTFPMTITSGDSVLIGTTVDSGFKLDVSGSVRISGSAQITGSTTISGGTTRIISTDTSVGPLLITHSYGVNDTSQYQRWALIGRPAFNNFSAIAIGSAGSNAGAVQGLTSLDTVAGPLLLNPFTGNVGVGWNGVPAAAFHISGSSGSALLKVDSNSSSNIIYVSGSGNVGIGTASPTQKLHVNSGNAFVNGVIYFGDGSHYLTTDNSTYALLSSNRNLQLGRSGVAALTVASTNNILIGTTTDSGYKLDVSGSARINGTINMSGSLTNYNLIDYSGSAYNTTFKLRDWAWNAAAGVSLDSNNIYLNPVGEVRTAGSYLIVGSTYTSIGAGYPATTARLTVRGPGATSATTAIRVENTNASASMVVLDNGFVGINTGSAQYNLDVNGDARATNLYTGIIYARSSALQYISTGGSSLNQHLFTVTLNQNPTSGDTFLGNFSSTFNPTSGTATYANIRLVPTINQTGGANGITRGLYINPTLTAAADFRAIETTAGNVIFGGTGSVTISNILTLTPQSPLPSGVATGSFAVSSSVPPKPYFYDGTTWNALY